MAVKTQEILSVEGQEIILSNPEKYLWRDSNITKRDYLHKLAQLSPYLLDYCRNRYMTTIRFPHGAGGTSFYQKNWPDPLPSFVNTAELNGIRYINLDSLPTLLWLGNLACLEFHPSLNYIGDELPAEWLIDIDPSLEHEPRLMTAVRIIGEVLDKMNILAIPKTSGATGVQIYVPIVRGYTFDQLRKIGHFIGKYITEKHPQLFTLERLKKNRGSLIYFDYLQHYHGKTIAAPYTPRARPYAPVSTPLTWSEVEMNVSPADFHLLNIIERLQRTGDFIANAQPQSLRHVLEFVGG